MTSFNEPDILAPGEKEIAPHTGQRTSHGQSLFSDENLDILSHVLDDWFCIPGTSIRFGLDGIVGFIPGLGDVLAGLASCILIIAAWFRGVPYITLARMIANVALEVGIGSVPFLGDVFVVFWKANRRNYALLMQHLDQPHRNTWRDWVFLWAIGLGLFAVFLAPVVVLVLLILWIGHR